jgi:hypothetical protein
VRQRRRTSLVKPASINQIARDRRQRARSGKAKPLTTKDTKEHKEGAARSDDWVIARDVVIGKTQDLTTESRRRADAGKAKEIPTGRKTSDRDRFARN